MGLSRAQIGFTPALSKRIIAKGVAALPEVRRAFEKGKILISTGLTTAHIFIELTGAWAGDPLACGVVSAKGTCVGRAMTAFLNTHGHARFWYFEKGNRVRCDDPEEALENFAAEDVFIKGANAIDSQGKVGVLLGVETGGFLGKSIGHVMAKGIRFVLPVGLEKTILGSVEDAAREMGVRNVDYTTGMPVGLLPVSGIRITELEAIKVLASVDVIHVASGGSAGGEGTVVLLVKGDCREVEKVIEIFKDIRRDERFGQLVVEPSLCGEHKWKPCAEKNILYTENIRQGK
jgi:hypothetical protein